MSERAEYFNMIASDPQYNAKKLIKDLQIEKGDVILDYGCGGGFFSYAFSKLVGSSGKVIASDINNEFLSYVNNQAKQRNLRNIQTLHVFDLEFNIQEKSLNIIFFRNVTHHMSNRLEIFKILNKFLSDSGKVIILDYTQKGNKMGHGPPGHYVESQKLVEEMSHAGFILKGESDHYLPAQSFSVFKKST